MFIARHPGRVLVTAVVLVCVGLWVAFPPDDDGTRPDFLRQYLGEMIGSTMMVLMAMALLLSTRFRFLELLFGGLDKVYSAISTSASSRGCCCPSTFWSHRSFKMTYRRDEPPDILHLPDFSILILLSLAPRLPVIRKLIRMRYGGWRITHKFMGIFFIMGTAHMMLVDPLVRTTVVPFAVLMMFIAIGIASYLYAELFAEFARRTAVYQVQGVNRLTPKVVEIVLQPVKKRLNFTAGQFAFVRF